MLRKFATYALFVLTALGIVGCGAEYQLHKAEQSYAIGEYTNAAALYKKAYAATPSKERKERGERAFMLGECYRHINYYTRAAAAYQNAIRYKHPDSTAVRYLAEMQLASGKYKDAAKNFEAYLKLNPDDRLAQFGLESCTLSQEWKSNPTRFVVKKDAILNSRMSDFSPVFGNDTYTQLYFTSSRNEAAGEGNNGITGMKSCDIFVSEQDEKGVWQKPTPIEGGPNSEEEDGSCSFSSDFQTMYLTRCVTDPELPRPAQIFQSQRSDASWQEARNFQSETDTVYSYAHPVLSPDGEWIYFTSDMDGGYGGLDIWRMPVDGRLLAAENLGPTINTAGNEMFPTFRRNGEFYFSSDGWPGMGGLDIFMAEQTDDETWVIQNMQSPINSYADDFGMTFEGDYTRGFFSSNRNDGRGRDNIYSFYLPEIVHNLTGWVYEKDGYELPDAIVYIVGNEGTNQKVGVKKDGSFTFRLTPGASYVLLGTAKGFLNYKQEITADSVEENREYVLQFPLSSINRPVLIDNIFYDFDKATLRPESEESLLQLVVLLNDNPNVTIELGAHCDYKGNDQYNDRLSQRRAESVVNFLVRNGIEPERLSAHGYGESKPKIISKKLAEQYDFLEEGQELTEEFILTLSEEQQETCNQLNRRTEFQVLRTTYGLYE